MHSASLGWYGTHRTVGVMHDSDVLAARDSYVGLVRSALGHCGRAVVRATGLSMLPTIQPGARVTIVAQRFDAVRPGDVIAFALGPDIFIHRVAERNSDRLVTIGDNMPLFDPPVTAADFLGCARLVGSAAPDRDAARPRHVPVAADLTGTVIWSPRPPADSSVVASLAALGATLRTAERHTLRTALATAPGGTRVGVSSSAAGRAESIPALIRGMPGHCHLLVGYRFGGHQPAVAECLPPDIVDHHVRPGKPLLEVSLEQTLAVVVAAFGRIRVPDSAVRVP
jgi:hypothetical protein